MWFKNLFFSIFLHIFAEIGSVGVNRQPTLNNLKQDNIYGKV